MASQRRIKIWLLRPHLMVLWAAHGNFHLHTTQTMCPGLSWCPFRRWKYILLYFFFISGRWEVHFCVPKVKKKKNPTHLVSGNRNDVRVYLHIERRGVGSDLKWSLELHVETHSNGRCELTLVILWPDHPGRMLMPGVNSESSVFVCVCVSILVFPCVLWA